ncbi:MAG: biopolymer transporter ExbD [Bacteroidales bacterium]|nr:biopolymer transporter ExbD [Bacteroidales bacterium]MCF8390717.1 biopolymer transporter ExbD [Bacteroidales bacterium]
MAIASRNKININFAMSGMTDIVFLLLIFFMIVSTLIVPGVSDVDLPHSNNQTVSSPELSVSISKELKYYVDGEEISQDLLESKLIELLAGKTGNPTVRLNADENLAWDQVMQFINIAKRNKLKVILGTRPM